MIDGEVYYDENVGEWIAYVPTKGRIVQKDGTDQHYPDWITSWIMYDESDTGFENPIEVFDLIQVQCSHESNHETGNTNATSKHSNPIWQAVSFNVEFYIYF